MGLKVYCRLIKNKENRQKIKKYYLIDILSIIVIYVAFIVLTSIKWGIDVLSISSIALLPFFVWSLLYRKFFVKKLNMFIDEDKLQEDALDNAFLAYKNSYKEYDKKFTRAVRVITTINGIIIFAIALLSILKLTNIIKISYLDGIMSIGIVLILVLLFFPSFIFGMVKGWWEQGLFEEIKLIEEYIKEKPYVSKYKAIYDATVVQQIEYLYPDEQLRKKALKQQKVFRVIFFAIIIIGAFLLSFRGIDWIEQNNILIVIALSVVLAISNSIYSYNLEKKQICLLKLNGSEENKKYIALHDMRRKHKNKWNKIFLIELISAVLIYFIGIAIMYRNITEKRLVTLFLSILGAFIFTYITSVVICYKEFGKVRQKMQVIEKQIDEIKIIEQAQCE